MPKQVRALVRQEFENGIALSDLDSACGETSVFVFAPTEQCLEEAEEECGLAMASLPEDTWALVALDSIWAEMPSHVSQLSSSADSFETDCAKLFFLSLSSDDMVTSVFPLCDASVVLGLIGDMVNAVYDVVAAVSFFPLREFDRPEETSDLFQAATRLRGNTLVPTVIEISLYHTPSKVSHCIRAVVLTGSDKYFPVKDVDITSGDTRIPVKEEDFAWSLAAPCSDDQAFAKYKDIHKNEGGASDLIVDQGFSSLHEYVSLSVLSLIKKHIGT